MRADGGRISVRGSSYWIVPADDGEIQLIRDRSAYGLGRHTPGRKAIIAGDWLCFYSSMTGVVGYAQAVSQAELRPGEPVTYARYPLVVMLNNVTLFQEKPHPINEEMRRVLLLLKGRNPKYWGRLIQVPRRLDRRDFDLLTQPP